MKRILVAIDGSDHSDKVVDEAIKVAKGLDASVTVLKVTGEYDFKTRISVHMSDEYWEQIKKNMKTEAEEIVNQAAAKMRESGLQADTKVLVGKQPPAEGICKMADRDGYDLVILGSHKLKGFKEAFLGSVSNKVAHCTKTNVMIIK